MAPGRYFCVWRPRVGQSGLCKRKPDLHRLVMSVPRAESGDKIERDTDHPGGGPALCLSRAVYRA